MHERGDDVVEDDPVGDPAAVAAKRMAGVEGRPVEEQGGELAPEWFEQA
jgi:hypothetical protein